MEPPREAAAVSWIYPVKTDVTGRPVVVGIRDADTWQLLLDAGCYSGLFPWLRLSGVNAPEAGTPGGEQAVEWVRDVFAAAREIRVTVHGRSFDRWVASVWVDSRDLAVDMIAAGHAVLWPTRQRDGS